MDDIKTYQRELATERKARGLAEQQLEIQSRALFEKNQALKKALTALEQQQAYIVMQERLGALGHLTAGLAHEVNNPNAFIISNLCTLRRYAKDLVQSLQTIFELSQDHLAPDNFLNQQIHQILKEIDFSYLATDIDLLIQESEQGAQRIKQLIDNLQCFTKTQAAQVNLSTQSAVNLNACLEQAIEYTKAILPLDYQLKNHTNDLPNIIGESTLITQAITYILTNAVEAQPKTIELTSTFNSEWITLSIVDDGIGIPEDAASKIFQAFFTTKETTRGLGLSVSLAIIQQHKGDIEIQSENGRTHANIKLPVVQTQAP